MQLGDSTLPVGSFSFSNGLESAIQQGVVRDGESLRGFIRTATLQAATSDGVALLEAFRAASCGDEGRIRAADHAVLNRKLNEEMRLMSVRMGRKLAELVLQIQPSEAVSDWLRGIRAGDVPGTYPVGQGIAFASFGLTEHDAFAVHQYGAANMMIGAALRLMRLNYMEAQSILFEVNAHAEADYARVASLKPEQMASFAPELDILAAIHVQANVRMFMN